MRKVCNDYTSSELLEILRILDNVPTEEADEVRKNLKISFVDSVSVSNNCVVNV